MKIISLFNNKGGVGKSTLGYHLGYALNEMGHKTLFIDLDPQCNLTICSIEEEALHKIWDEEDSFIEDYEKALQKNPKINETPRSIHFLLKPTEEGVSDLSSIPPAIKLDENLYLIPGRLSLHKYENKLAERWNGAYQGDNLAIRTITNIRNICEQYSEQYDFEYVIIDTSPSLGILNKTIISTVDGFFIPAQPDMFSLYGIRNIGNSLELWQKEFETIYSLISEDKRNKFPKKFVQFLGFTIYNAKKYSSGKNEYNLADAHDFYLKKIPDIIEDYIKQCNRSHLSDYMLHQPIGGSSVIHTHNTFPSVAQALKCPMWKVPDKYDSLSKEYKKILKENSFEVNTGSYGKYRHTKQNYMDFAKSLLERVATLEKMPISIT
ncbi:ParA family protein [Crenothrix sp.]|uniref:ParA family protein n=1 Tax=Crenothrix sp. TaxID=3100433 RepID=UPI00374CDAC5